MKFLIVSFFLVIFNDFHALHSLYRQPTDQVRFILEARNAAKALSPRITRISELEDASLQFEIAIKRKYNDTDLYSKELRKKMRHEFRQTLLDAKMKSWMQAVENMRLPAIIETASIGEYLNEFRKQNAIFDNKEYMPLVEHLERRLKLREIPNYRLNLHVTGRAQPISQDEYDILVREIVADQPKLIALKKIESLKNFLSEMIDLTVRTMEVEPSLSEKILLLQELKSDISPQEVSAEQLQSLMKFAEQQLDKQLQNKFEVVYPTPFKDITPSRDLSVVSPVSPRSAHFSPSQPEVVEIPNEGRQTVTPQRRSHFRPLTHPLPKN